jgi:hypothetical protein
VFRLELSGVWSNWMTNDRIPWSQISEFIERGAKLNDAVASLLNIERGKPAATAMALVELARSGIPAAHDLLPRILGIGPIGGPRLGVPVDKAAFALVDELEKSLRQKRASAAPRPAAEAEASHA